MKRPISVTIILWLVLSLTAWSGLRLATAILWRGTLLEFASSPGPAYIAISGALWLLAGIGLLWGMWQAKAWIRSALLGTGAGFFVWYWCDRLLLQFPRANWPFALAVTILLLILLSVCVFLPGTKTFFTKREAHEQ
jgi:hypothetical protein